MSLGTQTPNVWYQLAVCRRLCTKKHISVHRQESKLNVYHMRCRRKILGITTTGSAILHLMKIVFICVTCNRDCHSVAPQVTTDVVLQWSVIPSSHYTEGDRWWILSWVFFIRPKYDSADSGNLLVNPESWTSELSSRNPESSTWNPKSTAFQSLSYLGWHYPFAVSIVVCYTAVFCVITQRSFLETKMASLFAFLHVILKNPQFQNEARCTTFLVKMSFYYSCKI